MYAARGYLEYQILEAVGVCDSKRAPLGAARPDFAMENDWLGIDRAPKESLHLRPLKSTQKTKHNAH